MKKAVLAISLSLAATALFAQGSVNFINSPMTLVSAGWGAGIMSGPPGLYYFGLLIAPEGTTEFSFRGNYATNQYVPGRFSGGLGVQVPGWTPGKTMSYEVVGWSANLGVTFNPSWLWSLPTNGFFGWSSIGTGVAGGFDGTGPLPPLNLFGGATGIQTGFYISPPIPEPSSVGIAAVGLGTVLQFRKIRARYNSNRVGSSRPGRSRA
jgi:hypothetical protein